MVTASTPKAPPTPETATARRAAAILNAAAPDTTADTSAAPDPVRAHQARVAALQIQALEFLVQFSDAHFESNPKEARLAATAVLKADLTPPPAPAEPRSLADKVLEDVDDMLEASMAAKAYLALHPDAAAEEEGDLDDDDDDDDDDDGDDDVEPPDEGDDDDEEAGESEKEDDDPLGDDDGHVPDDSAGRAGVSPSRFAPTPDASSS